MLAACVLLYPYLAAGQEYVQLDGAIHVHSTFSSGSLTIEQLAELAQARRLDVLILTDSVLVSAAYGLWPFRNLLKRTVSRNSILRGGAATYLAEIERVGRAHPSVLVIPGAEVAPFYYWEGSPLAGTLVLRDWRRHILALDLDEPEEYEAFPVLGNGALAIYRWDSLFKIWPVVLVVVGYWVSRQRRKRGIRLHHFRLVREVRYRKSGWGLMIVGGMLLANNFPFTVSPYDQYHGSAGIEPYQRAIDYIEEWGGLAVWAHVESKFAEQTIGPITLRTDPHPEVLHQTTGYTALEAVYGDITTATNPGGHWDQLLTAYLEGNREGPPWGIGGVDFHAPREGNAWFELDGVETVFLVAERSRGAVLDAVRAGRIYAAFQGCGARLRLNGLRLVNGEGDVAVVGESLPAVPPVILVLQASFDDNRVAPVNVRIIRSGQVLKSWERETPLYLKEILEHPSRGDSYYRLEIRTSECWILSNPVFLIAES